MTLPAQEMSSLYGARFRYHRVIGSVRHHGPGAPVNKLAVVVLLVVAACQRKVEVGSVPSANPGPNASGATTAREALQLFLATAKAQDLQAMSNVWGSASGSA